MTKSGQNRIAATLQAAACSVTAASLALCCQVALPQRALADEEGAAPAEAGQAAAEPDQPAQTPEPASADDDADAPASSSETIAPVTAPEALTSSDAESLEEEAERLAKEEEAAGKRAEADSLYGEISALNAPLQAARTEYEAASQRHDEAVELKEATEEQLEAERTALESVKESVSDYVVDLYKQGGAAPYLDVICRSTSYREFLTSWYMANEVARYGHQVLDEKNRVIYDLETAVSEYERQIADAENDMTAADAKVKQAELTQCALAVQAASLRVEAATIVGDDEALGQALAELDGANAALDGVIAAGAVGGNLLVGNGFFTDPLPGATISSGFGYRAFTNSFHRGLDMAADSGTPYYAADSGTVISANNDGDYNGGAGNMVVIDHGNGIVTKYMHSLVVLVRAGDHVERGQNIGLVGSTGHSTGPHLHFQVEINGAAVNPANYI